MNACQRGGYTHFHLPEGALTNFRHFFIFVAFVAVGKIVVFDVLLFLHQRHGPRGAGAHAGGRRRLLEHVGHVRHAEIHH